MTQNMVHNKDTSPRQGIHRQNSPGTPTYSSSCSSSSPVTVTRFPSQPTPIRAMHRTSANTVNQGGSFHHTSSLVPHHLPPATYAQAVTTHSLPHGVTYSNPIEPGQWRNSSSNTNSIHRGSTSRPRNTETQRQTAEQWDGDEHPSHKPRNVRNESWDDHTTRTNSTRNTTLYS